MDISISTARRLLELSKLPLSDDADIASSVTIEARGSSTLYQLVTYSKATYTGPGTEDWTVCGGGDFPWGGGMCRKVGLW